MLKILFIGDPHFKINNIPEVDMFVKKVVSLVTDTSDLDYIVVGGDLLHYHERLHTECLNRAHDFILQLSRICPTYVLVGNHDMISNQQFLTDKHWMNGMKNWPNVHIIDRVEILHAKNKTLLMCPYVYPGRFKEALDTRGDNWVKSDMIFCHQEFRGAKMGAIVSEVGDEWPIDNPQVIAGHIHQRQIPQSNIYYAGSSMQHAFGESQGVTLAMVSLNDKGFDIDEIDLQLPGKRIIRVDIEDIDEYEMPDNPKRDRIRLTVTGIYEKFKAFRKTTKFKSLIKQGVKIIYKHKKMDNYDIHNKSSDINDFQIILGKLIKNENNIYLNEIYHTIIINDK